MEVISGNDGLLTNVEVLEVLKENRSRRGRVDAIKIDLQNRENVETKVRCIHLHSPPLLCPNQAFFYPQAIKYISGTVIGHLTSTVVGECISKIKKLNLGLTEGEIVQIANLAPENEVEFYLVRNNLH
jgi:hypothetical protein